MLRISIHRLYKERSNVPKDKPFFLYDDKTIPTHIALGIKINDKFYNSDWIPEDAKDWKDQLMKAMQQIAIIQKTGWAKLREEEDEFGYPVMLFRCAYCNVEAYQPTKECSCRKKIDNFTMNSGFILPKTWDNPVL